MNAGARKRKNVIARPNLQVVESTENSWRREEVGSGNDSWTKGGTKVKIREKLRGGRRNTSSSPGPASSAPIPSKAEGRSAREGARKGWRARSHVRFSRTCDDRRLCTYAAVNAPVIRVTSCGECAEEGDRGLRWRVDPGERADGRVGHRDGFGARYDHAFTVLATVLKDRYSCLLHAARVPDEDRVLLECTCGRVLRAPAVSGAVVNARRRSAPRSLPITLAQVTRRRRPPDPETTPDAFCPPILVLWGARELPVRRAHLRNAATKCATCKPYQICSFGHVSHSSRAKVT